MNKKDFGIRPSFRLVLDCLKFGEYGVLSVIGKSAADQAISIERRGESGEIIELELSFSEASRLHNVLSTAINRIKSGKYDFIESGLLLVEDQEDEE